MAGPRQQWPWLAGRERASAVRKARTTRGATAITLAACLFVVLLGAVQAGTAERIEDVLAEMRQHRSDAKVQERGCSALKTLAFNNADIQVKIADAGGIEDVLEAMRGHRSHAGVQTLGSDALLQLAIDADNQVKIADAGGIADVLAAMRGHRSHAGVQERGLRALWNLALNADNQVKIVAAGGIADVLAGMRQHRRQHRSDAGVQEWGLRALLHLALNADNQVKIADAGGIADVLAAMRGHRSDAGVQKLGCDALWSLARNADNQVKITAAGGIADIQEAMRGHRSHAWVQEWGCRALLQLAINADNQVKITAAGGIADVLAAMRGHRLDAGVQEWGCRALLHFAINADYQVKIADAGGIADVLAAMRGHRSDAGVQEWGCRALWNLAFNADNQVKIADAGGIVDVLYALREHRSHAGVQERGCVALWSLANNADNIVKITAAGGIDDVLAAMREHKGNSRVEDFARLALHNLRRSVDGHVSKALRDSVAVSVVEAATSKDSQWWGQNMFDRLLQSEVLWEVPEDAQRAALKEREADVNAPARVWKLLATGLAVLLCCRFVWSRRRFIWSRDGPPEAKPPANPSRVQAPEVLADRHGPAVNADAQTDAKRITAAARAEAQRIKAAAKTAAQQVQAAARAEAQRITREAQETAEAASHSRVEAERITAAAQAEAQRMTAAAQEQAQAAACSRASVAIFFRAELAEATGGFADAHCIGSGGFGSVYHAPRLRGLGGGGLAIKKLDMASMQGQTAFLQEVQVLGACRHENLTPLLGFAADSGASGADGGVCLMTPLGMAVDTDPNGANDGMCLCLVMPLMRGGSLSDRLILDGPARVRLSKLPGTPVGGFEPLFWQQRLVVAVDAVRGLLFLHTPDADTHKPAILHCDLKPSNILLDLDGHARLADMGLARARRSEAAHITTATSIAGTDGYLDEYYQSTGMFDERADAYAVGVTLLVLLTGRRAFDSIRGHIIGQCDVNPSEVASLSDTTAQWPSAVAAEVHAVAMDLVRRNRESRITLSAALQRLEQLVDANQGPTSARARTREAEDVERECFICMSAPRHVRFGW